MTYVGVLTVILELPGADRSCGRLPENDDVLDSPVERRLSVALSDAVGHVRHDRVVGRV